MHSRTSALAIAMFFFGLQASGARAVSPAASLFSPMPPVYITIRSELGVPAAESWKGERCAVIRAALQDAASAPCDLSESDSLLKAARQAGTYKFHLAVKLAPNGLILVNVENWRPKDDLEFEAVGWKFERGASQTAQDFVLKKKLTDFQASVVFDRLQRERALVLGSRTSKVITVDPISGEYLERGTGRILSYEEAEEKFVTESKTNRHYLRTAVELGAILGAGGVMYASFFADVNQRDWDFQLSIKEQRRRFIKGDGLRFDSNAFLVNSTHAYAGALYYLFAKTNGMNTLESTLISFATSALWEAIVEYHEAFSINDMIMTPMAALSVGEAFFQLGGFFNTGRTNTLKKIVSGILNGPDLLHRWMDKNPRPSPAALDRYGFDASRWHNFELFAGLSASTVARPHGGVGGETVLGVDLELANIPGFGREGKTRGLYMDTAFSQLLVRYAQGTDGIHDFLVFTKVALLGYYKQDVTNVDEKYRGYSFFVGPATALELANQRTDSGAHLDQLGIVNVIGPTLDLTYYAGKVKIRATIDVYADFAQVRSMAVFTVFEENGFNELLAQAKASTDHATREAFEDGRVLGTKAILELDRSYFAVGLTGLSKIVVQYRGFEAGLRAQADTFDSIDSLDRWQQTIDPERLYPATDSRVQTAIWGAYRIPHTDLHLRVSRESTSRRGTLGNRTVGSEIERYFGALLFRF